MATHIEYTQRVANSRGEFPIEARNLVLGVHHDSSPIILEVGENPSNPGNMLVRIDSCHSPQDFADAITAILHGMAGDLEDTTSSLKTITQPEPLPQVEPTGEGEPLDGEIVEHAEA